MKRRAYIVGVLMVGLLATAPRMIPAYGRVASSAAKFQEYFRDLKQANTMSPIERVIFSLVLTNAKTPQTLAVESEMPFGRT